MDELKELFSAVIVKAAEDWRDCIRDELAQMRAEAKGEEPVSLLDYGVSYAELRRFFNSEYCSGLCEMLGVDSGDILAKLEGERAFMLRQEERIPA